MRKFLFVIVPLLAICFTACDVNFDGYTDGHPTWDWKEFDAVFAAESPYEMNDEMFFKINFLEGGVVSGEFHGMFWATFTGTYQQGEFNVEMTYVNNYCIEQRSYAYFQGAIADDMLTGTMQVRSCEWFEFDYDGELVHGEAQ